MRRIKNIKHYLDGKSFIYDDVLYEIFTYDDKMGILFYIKERFDYNGIIQDEIDFVLYYWEDIEDNIKNGYWKIRE